MEMSTSLTNHKTGRKKTVHWDENWAGQQQEEEASRVKKIAFKERRLSLKARKKAENISHEAEQQQQKDNDYAYFLYTCLMVDSKARNELKRLCSVDRATTLHVLSALEIFGIEVVMSKVANGLDDLAASAKKTSYGSIYNAWNDYVEDYPFAQIELIRLLKHPPVLNIFRPFAAASSSGISSANSSQRRYGESVSDALRRLSVYDTGNTSEDERKQKIWSHAAKEKNPDNPDAALGEFEERWSIKGIEDPPENPPVSNLNDQDEKSETSDLTDPSQKSGLKEVHENVKK